MANLTIGQKIIPHSDSQQSISVCMYPWRCLKQLLDATNQGSQPGSTRNPYSTYLEAIKKNVAMWRYHSATNSSEWPYYYYYYHIFLVSQHKKLTFSLFLRTLGNKMSIYDIISPRAIGDNIQNPNYKAKIRVSH